jgi:hypothetical protein
VADAKNRDNSEIAKLMRKFPDWDWDYWMAQLA